MKTLIALPYSPWSEKARWALDFQGIVYREEAYQPLFGEAKLRKRTGLQKGKVQVPVFIDDGKATFDSFEIAKLADNLSEKPPLIPAEWEGEIEEINRLAEKALTAGRALLLHHVKADKEAQLNYVPPVVPRFLRGLLGPPIAKMGLYVFGRKYGTNQEKPEVHLANLSAAIEHLAKRFDNSRGTFLERFSFADIAVSAALQVVTPISNEYLRVPRRGIQCWGNPEVAEANPELLDWRDQLYLNYRKPAQKPA